MSLGISVSRVGFSAQTSRPVKKISGGIKLALAQYRELAAFSPVRLRSRRDDLKNLNTAGAFTELMKQRR